MSSTNGPEAVLESPRISPGLRVTASQESLEALDRLAKLPILTIDLKYVCSKTIRVDYIFTFGINKGKIKRTYAGRYIETDTAD